MPARLETGEEEPVAVTRAVAVHQRRLDGAPGLGARHPAESGLQAQVPPEDVGAGPQQRDLHHPSAPGVTLFEDRSEDARECGQSADVVADTAPHVQRDSPAVRQLGGQPGPGPERTDVVGRTVAVVPAEPVAAHAAVDEVGMAFHGRRRLEVEVVERVGPEVADEDVGGGQELLQGRPTGPGPQVEDRTALPAVVECEGGIGDVVAQPDGREDVAGRIAPRRLHLDHVRTPVGQEGGGGRCRDPDAQFDHPEIGQ